MKNGIQIVVDKINSNLDEMFKYQISRVLTNDFGNTDVGDVAINYIKENIYNTDGIESINDRSGTEIKDLLIETIIKTEYTDRNNMQCYAVGWDNPESAEIAKTLEYGKSTNSGNINSHPLLTTMLISQEDSAFYGQAKNVVGKNIDNILTNLEVK